MITKQGLEQSLWTALEFGYVSCEKHKNLQQVLSEAKPHIKVMVEKSGLPSEIVRIMTRHVSSPLLEK